MSTFETWVTDRIAGKDPDGDRLYTEIRERLEHCPCARDILSLVRTLLQREAARTWGGALAQPMEEIMQTQVKARAFQLAGRKIESILRDIDGTRRTP